MFQVLLYGTGDNALTDLSMQISKQGTVVCVN